MVFLICLIVIAIIFYVAYKAARFLLNPSRKIDSAIASGAYYFKDDAVNARKNFSITYKGILFTGEKYKGIEKGHAKVVSIFVWMDDSAKLNTLSKKDLQFLEKEIQKKYPNAKINWKNPIEQVMVQEE